MNEKDEKKVLKSQYKQQETEKFRQSLPISVDTFWHFLFAHLRLNIGPNRTYAFATIRVRSAQHCHYLFSV